MITVSIYAYQPLQCEVALRASGPAELRAAVDEFKATVPRKWRVYYPERKCWRVLPTRRVLGKWLARAESAGARLLIDEALRERLRGNG